MDIAQIEAFIAVCRIHNFTKAAEYLHISQSAVTARIKALEASVGKTLLNRDNRNVSLTQAGIHFLPYAERIQHLYEESRVTLAEQVEDYVVLSGPGSVWHYYYLSNILAFRNRYPNVAIKFLSYMDASYMVRDLLLDGIVQVAIRFDPPETPKVTRHFLFEDEIIVVAAQPREAPIQQKDFFSKQYCHLEWGHPFPEWFSSLMGTGFVPSLYTDHSSIMLTMLLQGAGFGFMPRSIVKPFLDSNQLFDLPCDFATPTVRAYALYLSENRDHSSVKLGLKMLGIECGESKSP